MPINPQRGRADLPLVKPLGVQYLMRIRGDLVETCCHLEVGLISYYEARVEGHDLHEAVLFPKFNLVPGPEVA